MKKHQSKAEGSAKTFSRKFFENLHKHKHFSDNVEVHKAEPWENKVWGGRDAELCNKYGDYIGYGYSTDMGDMVGRCVSPDGISCQMVPRKAYEGSVYMTLRASILQENFGIAGSSSAHAGFANFSGGVSTDGVLHIDDESSSSSVSFSIFASFTKYAVSATFSKVNIAPYGLDLLKQEGFADYSLHCGDKIINGYEVGKKVWIGVRLGMSSKKQVKSFMENIKTNFNEGFFDAGAALNYIHKHVENYDFTSSLMTFQTIGGSQNMSSQFTDIAGQCMGNPFACLKSLHDNAIPAVKKYMSDDEVAIILNNGFLKGFAATAVPGVDPRAGLPTAPNKGDYKTYFANKAYSKARDDIIGLVKEYRACYESLYVILNPVSQDLEGKKIISYVNRMFASVGDELSTASASLRECFTEPEVCEDRADAVKGSKTEYKKNMQYIQKDLSDIPYKVYIPGGYLRKTSPGPEGFSLFNAKVGYSEALKDKADLFKINDSEDYIEMPSRLDYVHLGDDLLEFSLSGIGDSIRHYYEKVTFQGESISKEEGKEGCYRGILSLDASLGNYYSGPVTICKNNSHGVLISDACDVRDGGDSVFAEQHFGTGDFWPAPE